MGGQSHTETDARIFEELETQRIGLTYAIANGIRHRTGHRYSSATILRRLRAMEKTGSVRCLGFRGNMYEWALATGEGEQ